MATTMPDQHGCHTNKTTCYTPLAILYMPCYSKWAKTHQLHKNHFTPLKSYIWCYSKKNLQASHKLLPGNSKDSKSSCLLQHKPYFRDSFKWELYLAATTASSRVAKMVESDFESGSTCSHIRESDANFCHLLQTRAALNRSILHTTKNYKFVCAMTENIVFLNWEGGDKMFLLLPILRGFVMKQFDMVQYHILPEYLRKNEYIMRHYRSGWPLSVTFWGIFSICNWTWHMEALPPWLNREYLNWM